MMNHGEISKILTLDLVNAHHTDLINALKNNKSEKFEIDNENHYWELSEKWRQRITSNVYNEICKNYLTEEHVFSSLELAENFIRHRFPDYRFDEETHLCKIYICPHGEQNRCSGFVRIFHKIEKPVIQACFSHYGHDSNLGQYRLTGIQIAIIRLYCHLYWNFSESAEYNASNVVAGLRHWFKDDHPLHYVTMFDLRKAAIYTGRNLVGMSVIRVYHEEYCFDIGKTARAYENEHDMNVKRLKEKRKTFRSKLSEKQENFCRKERNANLCNVMLAIKKWMHITRFAQELKKIVYFKMISPISSEGCSTSEKCEQLRAIYLNLNETISIVEVMTQRFWKIMKMYEGLPDAEFLDVRLNMNNIQLQELFPQHFRSFLVPTLVEQKRMNAKEANGPPMSCLMHGLLLNIVERDTPNCSTSEDSKKITTGVKKDVSKNESVYHEKRENDYSRYKDHSMETLRSMDENKCDQHRKTSNNVWKCPIPATKCFPFWRFQHATGINFRELWIGMREQELDEWRTQFEKDMGIVEKNLFQWSAPKDSKEIILKKMSLLREELMIVIRNTQEKIDKSKEITKEAVEEFTLNFLSSHDNRPVQSNVTASKNGTSDLKVILKEHFTPQRSN